MKRRNLVPFTWHYQPGCRSPIRTICLQLCWSISTTLSSITEHSSTHQLPTTLQVLSTGNNRQRYGHRELGISSSTSPKTVFEMVVFEQTIARKATGNSIFAGMVLSAVVNAGLYLKELPPDVSAIWCCGIPPVHLADAETGMVATTSSTENHGRHLFNDCIEKNCPSPRNDWLR